jgi:hypothetical protein
VKWLEPVAAQRRAWREWVKGRPESIREAIEKYKLDPWTIYKLKTTGQIVSLRSISEPAPTKNQEISRVTISVNVDAKMNGLAMPSFGVFGIDPTDLEEYESTTKS